MMGLSLCLFLFFIFLLNLFKGCNTSTSHEQPSYCPDEERSALLQFKHRFTINISASGLEGAYPKTLSWKPAQGGNNSSCCAWDGVKCDEQTGHVIELDLSSSYLYGSINSNSSLFRLVHLQRLNLADNHFKYSPIPSTIRNLPMLTELDLSFSVFAGQVPSQLSQLIKLASLDLTSEDPISGEGLLHLDGSDFRSLVQNLTSLEYLHLRYINISSTIPHSISNLSFLTTLDLFKCDLFGDFPVVQIFHLQTLQNLYLRENHDLIGYLPEFNQSSRLITLDVHDTRFSGNFPSSIGKIGSLEQLDVAACNFSEGLVPSSIGNLRQLSYLDISANKFVGPIPESFANLTQLTVFRICTSTVTGPIPSWIGNFSQLVYLDLSYSRLDGSVPASFSNLTNLKMLYLQYNHLRGVGFHTFQNLQNLYNLDLSANNLEFHTDSVVMNATIQQFQVLGLARCNLTQFPYFLRNQNSLQSLHLDQNKIHGQVPKWMWNMSTKSLKFFNLAGNLLSGFEQLPDVLPWVNLRFLSLSSNMFHGPVPVPAASTSGYEAQDNNFSGEVPPGICNMSSLLALDMSNNNFSGMIPQCFGNFSDSLTLLLLRNNSFHGTLLQTYTNKSNLRMLDVSQNQLQGELPRSLANCLMLETLILSNNNLNDVFPFWLVALPELKLLSMRHNRFYGVIGKPKDNQRFPKLHLLDMSYNNFTGQFLAEDIFSQYAMRPNITVSQTTYIDADIRYESGNGVITLSYNSTITITSKGVDRYYSKIQEAFAVIDISCNKFEGKIDEWISNLKGLRSLNVSNNLLTGGIPSSLGNLTDLESLDLSSNKLSGEIPQQLAQLTFIAEFNVSHNHLTGPIPSGTQLGGFNVTSYEGNSGLCGDPLPKKCGISNTPALLPEENSSDSKVELDLKFMLAGLGSGLVVGVVLADLAITRRPKLFLQMVEIFMGQIEWITSCKRFGR